MQRAMALKDLRSAGAGARSPAAGASRLRPASTWGSLFARWLWKAGDPQMPEVNEASGGPERAPESRAGSTTRRTRPAGRAGQVETLAETRFGAIAVWGGFVSRETLDGILAEQSVARASGKDSQRIGEMLVTRGHLTEEQVRRVLKVQLQRLPAEGHLIFGQIAEAHRFISPEETRRALDAQSRDILAGGRARLIADILVENGAIDRDAVDAIISFQARGDSTHMSKARKAGVVRAAMSTRPDRVEEEPEARPGPRPVAAPRPVFLPRGWLGFVADHSTWIVIAAAALFAIVLIVLRERIFLAADEPDVRRPTAEVGAE